MPVREELACWPRRARRAHLRPGTSELYDSLSGEFTGLYLRNRKACAHLSRERTSMRETSGRRDLPAAGAALTPASVRDTGLRRPVSGGVHDGDLRLWARLPKRATLIVGICLGRST
jgi:hypothetical protein